MLVTLSTVFEKAGFCRKVFLILRTVTNYLIVTLKQLRKLGMMYNVNLMQ